MRTEEFENQRKIIDAMTCSRGAQRVSIAADAAPLAPDLLLEQADRWFNDEATPVLVALPTHWHRIAFAGALTPWSQEAQHQVQKLGQQAGWPAGDLDAVRRAMTGTDEHLNRPHSARNRPDERWRIVSGEPWRYTLWRASDGRYVLEIVPQGPWRPSHIRPLTNEEVRQIDGCEIGSLSKLLSELTNE